MRKLVIILLFIVLSALHVLSYAEPGIPDEKFFEKVRGKNPKDTLSGSDSLMLILKKEEDRRNAWSLTLAGNFTGDEAENKTTADLNNTLKITKGEYPRQFRFTIENRIRLRDRKLEDNVTAFLLNYDYYVHRFVEVYTFVERFSDNYMDIKQRFEIGLGAKLELTELLGMSFGLVDDKDIRLIDSLPSPTSLTAEEESTLSHRKSTARISLRKRNARFSGSIAFSIFKELEQAEIVAQDTTLPTEERFRFVVRPSVELRVTENLRIGGYCYWKLPASKPRRENGKWDYRRDARIFATLELSQDKHGNDKVNLSVRYDTRFDSSPPSVELNGEEYTASQFHSTATLEISVRI